MNKEISSPTGPQDLASLLELRDLIANELDPAAATDNSQRIFRPLTDGLGLESPKKKEAEKPAAAAAPAAKKATPPPPVEVRPPVKVTPPPLQATPKTDFPLPPPMPTQRPGIAGLASVIESSGISSSDAGGTSVLAKDETPPPMPTATWGRRFLAGLIDQIFVLTLFCVALILTLRMFAGTNALMAVDGGVFQNPVFVRFAILEYATVWLAYFAIGVGILDMTFGMWVWSLRLRMSEDQSTSKFIKKGFRVFLSFFFFAPLFPVIFLSIHRKGRNLLDYLSGTSLYRAVG